MATLSSTVTIGKPHAGRGGDALRPPSGGGGDDGRGNAGDYSRRLRRARLGIVVAITPIVMLFVSFTSAYIVRQGLPDVRRSHHQLRPRLALDKPPFWAVDD